MNKKDRPPVAVCTVCGEYSTSITVINNQCFKQPGGKRCKGVFGSAIAPNDWEECEQCSGMGTKDGQRCGACQGSGFDYVRKGP